jgi:hypothetical protein
MSVSCLCKLPRFTYETDNFPRILSLALGIWVLYWFWSHKIHPSVEENVLNRRIKRLTNLVFGGITLYGAWEVHLACRDLWLSDQNMTYPVAFWQTLSLNHFAVFYFCIFWIRGNTLRTTRRATSQVRHTSPKPSLLIPILPTLPRYDILRFLLTVETNMICTKHTESKTTLLPTTSLSQCDSSAQQLSRPWSILSNMRDWSRVIYKMYVRSHYLVSSS